MRKSVISRSRKQQFNRLLSRLIVGGVLLFQGTGFITSPVCADEPVSRNRDVTSFVGTTNISDTSYNYGLYGTPLNQTVNIYGGVSSIVGKLTPESTSLNPAEAVSMSMNSGSAFHIGLDNSDVSSKGYLYISGPWGSTNTSTLTASSGSAIHVGTYGSLIVGYSESDDKGVGKLNINQGATLVNNGLSSTDFSGVVVLKDSQVHFGESESATALTDYYSGSGIFRNFGIVNIYNGVAGSDAFVVSNYIDQENTYGRGVLNVSGNALLGSSDTVLYGTVRIGGDLDISSASSNALFGTVSTVSVGGLASIYNDNATTGSDLKINSTGTTVGGLWVKRFADTEGNATGGALSIGGNSDTVAVSILNVTGLKEKFLADGTRSETGLYDVKLGRNLSNYGTINLDDVDGSGIIFTGASAVGDSEQVVGLHNRSIGKIVADGDLHLYGVDENASISGHSALSMTNQGSITVKGELDVDSASEISLTNSGTISASSMTVDDQLMVDNEVNGKFETTEVNLVGGSINNSGTYTFNKMNLSDGSLRGTYTGAIETVGTQVTQPKVSVTGMIDLDGTTEFVHETGDDQLELTITGNGGFNGKDNSLTFTDTAVNNVGSLSTSALTAQNINFNGNSAYIYSGTGANILNGNVSFDDNASLTVGTDDPLTIAAGKTLTMGSADHCSKLIFNIDSADETPLITLAPEGSSSAAADIHSDIIVTDSYKSYVRGTREITLIKTSNADSVYDINSINLSGTDSNNTLFVSHQGRVSDDKTSYLLDITNKGFSDFATTVNQRNAAGYIDSILRSPNSISEELGNFITDVMDLDADTDPAAVGRVLDALSGANRANALMLAMSDPWQYSFNQLGWQTHRNYTPECETCSMTCRGQMEYETEYYDGGMMYGGYPGASVFGYNGSVPNTVWAAAHTTSFNARDDDNCDKYGITNTGISIGYDVLNAADTTLGLTFDYSQPFLYSSWKDVSQHIDQSNFNLGLYGRRDYYNGFSLSGYVGFGLQHLNSKRDVRMFNIDEDLTVVDALGTGNWYRTGTNGHSFAAAVKIARDLPAYGWFVVRPMVQFDTQSAWIDASEEYGNAIALNYHKTDWNRTFVRGGFETEKNTQFCRLTSRFLYVQQLGGDSAPEMTASFVGDTTGNEMKIYGVDLGEKYFNAGFGAVGYLDCAYRWALSGNYDFAASEQSVAHTGTVALSYSF
ncbi:MAG: autotransporter domain-containing protein [Thermoguttaceae bacterium]|nr:autotransporter domain-containing protein [Thermoguttaceae bacterium]